MAPKLPRGFTLPSQETDKGKEPMAKARHVQKKRAGRTILLDTPPEATTAPLVVEVARETPPAKRPRTEGASTHVEALLSAAAKSVGENEVHAWQALEGEEEAQSMLRLSTQLVVHSLGRAKAAQQERVRREKLVQENQKLAAMVVENDNKWKKALDSKDAALAMIKEELKESFEHRDLLNGLVEELNVEKAKWQTERDDLSARLKALEDGQQDREDEAFERGFNYYLVGFMAQDPGYDWSKWGQGCVEDMRAFAVERAADIKQQRVKLGLEVGEEDEGAPTPEEAAQTSFVDTPIQTIAPTPAAPTLEEQDAPIGKDAP